jgi:hypothetical protein
MRGNIPRSDLQTPLGRTWNAESRRDLDARLPGNPESRYHQRQFGVHPGNPGLNLQRAWQKMDRQVVLLAPPAQAVSRWFPT